MWLQQQAAQFQAAHLQAAQLQAVPLPTAQSQLPGGLVLCSGLVCLHSDCQEVHQAHVASVSVCVCYVAMNR